jgi:8-oxo-dGTP pyrophosphatase MutT (NUDIX family)
MPAPAGSYQSHVGVHLILAEGRKVLLLNRANTGFADGCWSVPCGSVEHGETLGLHRVSGGQSRRVRLGAESVLTYGHSARYLLARTAIRSTLTQTYEGTSQML